jgi:hypothetical protein
VLVGAAAPWCRGDSGAAMAYGEGAVGVVVRCCGDLSPPVGVVVVVPYGEAGRSEAA